MGRLPIFISLHTCLAPSESLGLPFASLGTVRFSERSNLVTFGADSATEHPPAPRGETVRCVVGPNLEALPGESSNE